jgi:hypothetical protein
MKAHLPSKAHRKVGFFRACLVVFALAIVPTSCTYYGTVTPLTELNQQVRPRYIRYRLDREPYTGYATTDTSRFRVKDGLKNGMERVFYPSGSLRREINWKNGQRNGTERIYGPEGEQLARLRWKRGKERG